MAEKEIDERERIREFQTFSLMRNIASRNSASKFNSILGNPNESLNSMINAKVLSNSRAAI